ncbi:MAG: FeoC-like transcriptional regulator [Chloroflexota bacterium]
MLEQLLHEIQQGGTLEAGILAARLGTSPQMVAAMLHHLAQLGKLKNLADCTGAGCNGCSLAAMCGAEKGKRAHLWEIVA